MYIFTEFEHQKLSKHKSLIKTFEKFIDRILKIWFLLSKSKDWKSKKFEEKY